MKRKIAVFTGTRAEYGLLYWLMRAIESNPDLQLQVVVSGMHLAPAYGETWKQIAADGFTIDATVEMLLSSDTPTGITKSMGVGLLGFADAFANLRPNLLVLLGDRYEALAAAQAAMIARIPIAHLHGGEATEGLIDEAIRHSITKMSHLHFVATEEYRQRVIQLGEQPDRVWNVGAAGLDNIERLPALGRDELEVQLGIELRPPLFLVTYHPVTLCDNDAAAAMRTMLVALAGQGGAIVITGTNADTGNAALRVEAVRFAAEHPDRVVLVENLGVYRYLSLMRLAAAVVGNSSSGMLEAPAIGVPTVDIGERQAGRLQAPSVIHCAEDADGIRAAIAKALSPEHQAVAAARQTPYGRGGVAERVCAVLATTTLEGILQKRFYDIVPK